MENYLKSRWRYGPQNNQHLTSHLQSLFFHQHADQGSGDRIGGVGRLPTVTLLMLC